jgi:hypothetical protein
MFVWIKGIWKRIQGASREVLAVDQAMPIFAMHCVKLLNSLYEKLEVLTNNVQVLVGIKKR